MLADICLAILVLMVAVIVMIDVFRTSGEVPLEQDGEQPREIIRETRGVSADAVRPEPARSGPTATLPDAGPVPRPADGGDLPAGRHQRVGGASPASAKTSRRALKNWRVRSRLLLLVSIPTATAVAFGGLRIASAARSASMISRSSSLHDRAVTSVIIDSVVVFLVLALALLFTVIVGRSMVRPLRKLRAGALDVAGQQLPEAVRRMSGTDGEDVSLDVEPIDVNSSDEIGEVARAFDQVHREALRLAANEAALRGNVNAMFVNLSRRTQSLVERQIRLIDDLELGEQDPERLSNLFQMDHLATRMRRNSENLLVLAGHDVSRRWNQPVVLVDVLRAAVSEIEQYERVTLNVQPGIAVRGQAVNDVVHLLSELAENATSFSSADTPVIVAGHLLSSGGVLLDITDQGVGMGAEEMAHANWRLDNPPVVDVAVSRRMGLFVVARLAARHGIRVRLRPAASGGLTALVWLPDEAVTHDADGSSSGLGRSDLDAAPDPAAAAGFSAPRFATAGPALAGSVAGVFSTDEWGTGERSVAEEAVTAARTPRFAPLRADADDTGGFRTDTGGFRTDTGGFRTRRVPGAGPRPGETTGPQEPFRTSPQPASDAGIAPFAAGLRAPADDSPATGGQESPFGGGQESPFGGGQESPFGGGQESPFGDGIDMFGGGTTGMFGGTDGSATDTFGGAGTDVSSAGMFGGAGGSGQDTFGGSGTDTFGGSGTDTFGGSGTDTFGGAGGSGQDMFVPGGDGFGAAAEPAAAEPIDEEPVVTEPAAEEPVFSHADPFAASADGFGTAPQPVLGAPPAGKVADRPVVSGDSLSSMGWSPGSSVHSGVVVPPSVPIGEESRLPIFESVESDWFRRGRHAVAGQGPEQEEEKADSWSSPADDGWRAAELASSPSSDGLTPAGLPKRVPKANLVPGTAGLEPAAAPVALRSAAATRERFASFQRGVKEGRAAGRGDDETPDREDDGGM